LRIWSRARWRPSAAATGGAGRARPGSRREEGYILPAALLSLTVLSLLAIAAFESARLEGLAARSLAASIRAFYAADGGLASLLAGAPEGDRLDGPRRRPPRPPPRGPAVAPGRGRAGPARRRRVRGRRGRAGPRAAGPGAGRGGRSGRRGASPTGRLDGDHAPRRGLTARRSPVRPGARRAVHHPRLRGSVVGPLRGEERDLAAERVAEQCRRFPVDGDGLLVGSRANGAARLAADGEPSQLARP
jgi:hypothetical protein